MDIDELIAGALAGVPSAGPLLVSVLGPQVAAYARRISPDLSDTDRDLVAELAIEKAIRRFRRSYLDAQATATEQEVEGESFQGVWQPWREGERAVLQAHAAEPRDQCRPGPRK